MGTASAVIDISTIGICITLGFFLVALLYSAVGHGGASGYWAVASIAGLLLPDFKIVALTLNILVAGIGFFQFALAGHFRFRLFWPFALLSVPAALLGSQLKVDPRFFEWVVAIVLLLSVVSVLALIRDKGLVKHRLNLWAALPIGGSIGLVSGLIGIGGGIFLSPIMLLFRWATAKESAAVSALFIVVNSIAGLVLIPRDSLLQAHVSPLWIAAVLAGGIVGSLLGSRWIPTTLFRVVLAIVLLWASVKIIFF